MDIAPAGRAQNLGSNPVSPTSSSTIRENYTTSTPGLNRHLGSRSHVDIGRPYAHTLSDTPRTLIPPHSGMAFSPVPPIYGAPPYSHTSSPETQQSPPFQEQEDFHDIRLEDGQHIRPIIEAKVEKGFF